MNRLLLIILLGTTACSSEFKKGEIEFANEDYDEARTHYIKIDSSNQDFLAAKKRLLEIDRIRTKIRFDLAAKTYLEEEYADAKILFLQIDKPGDLLDEILTFLSKIDSIEKSRIVENVKLEEAKRTGEIEALRDIKGKIQKLLDELLSFKGKSDFHKYGFDIGYKYNRWLKDVQHLKNTPEEKLLLKQGFVPGDLEMLGLEYVGSKGRETEYSLWAKKTISGGLKNSVQ